MEAERQAANKLFLSLRKQSEMPSQLNVIAALANTNPTSSCSSSSVSSDSKTHLNDKKESNENINNSPLNKLILMDLKLNDEN